MLTLVLLVVLLSKKNNVASVDGIATVTYTTTTNDKITAKSGSQSLTIDVVAKQAAADIWVATTGSDDNDGSQASPVATITQKLLNLLVMVILFILLMVIM